MVRIDLRSAIDPMMDYDDEGILTGEFDAGKYRCER
jgi:hypothetical protein